jgi:hypothetical protein
MIIHRTPSHRRIPSRLALVLAVALSFVAAPAVSQVEEVQAPSAVIVAECAPATPVDHAINTKGAGANDRAAGSAAPCAAPAEPVATDHAIHPACQKAADKIACNRYEDFKATHKDD